MPPIQHDVPSVPSIPSVITEDTPVKSAGSKSLSITIGGHQYEISGEWAKNHPGGRVIYEFDERDATDVFNAFHSEHAHAMLKNFRRVPVQVATEIDAETRDFRELRESIIKQGLMKSSPAYYVWKTTSCLLMFAVVIALCISFPGRFWAILLAAFIFGAGMSQCGWLAHDYLHHQVFEDRRLNNLLGFFVGGVLQGFAITWWKNKHNTHHAVCNVHGHDPDIDTVPIVAWSDMDVPTIKTQSAMWRFWIRHQTIMFPLVLCFAQLSWRIQSVLVAISPEVRHPISERISLILHYTWVAWMTYAISSTWTDAVAFIALEEIFGSYGKAVPFVLNHGGCPVVSGDHKLSFLRLQVLTSRDVKPGLFIDWFMGGLNYQIEHHLFPTMPRHNLIKIKPIVQQLSKKHNIPYISVPFVEGFSQLFKSLACISSKS